MTDDRCLNCEEPMHRYGFPADADGHKPSSTACINTLRGSLDDALRFIERRFAQGDEEATEFLRERARRGQGRRYPEAFATESRP